MSKLHFYDFNSHWTETVEDSLVPPNVTQKTGNVFVVLTVFGVIVSYVVAFCLSFFNLILAYVHVDLAMPMIFPSFW